MQSLHFQVTPGRVKVNNVGVVCQHDDIIAVEVDLSTKHVSVSGGFHLDADGNTYPLIILMPTEVSVGVANADSDTVIDFTSLTGWSVFAAESGRYNVYVCLVKDETHEKANVQQVRCAVGEAVR